MLIEQNTSGFKKFGRIVGLKCPKCGSAKVFYKAKYPGSRPKMKEACDHCGYKFDREEGYFKGAVYLSYGLTLIEGVIAFLVAKFLVFGLSNRDVLLVTLAAMLFLGIWNYKIARVMWLNKYPQQEV